MNAYPQQTSQWWINNMVKQKWGEDECAIVKFQNQGHFPQAEPGFVPIYLGLSSGTYEADDLLRKKDHGLL